MSISNQFRKESRAKTSCTLLFFKIATIHIYTYIFAIMLLCNHVLCWLTAILQSPWRILSHPENLRLSYYASLKLSLNSLRLQPCCALDEATIISRDERSNSNRQTWNMYVRVCVCVCVCVKVQNSETSNYLRVIDLVSNICTSFAITGTHASYVKFIVRFIGQAANSTSYEGTIAKMCKSIRVNDTSLLHNARRYFTSKS